jgi:hypothetical protein
MNRLIVLFYHHNLAFRRFQSVISLIIPTFGRVLLLTTLMLTGCDGNPPAAATLTPAPLAPTNTPLTLPEMAPEATVAAAPPSEPVPTPTFAGPAVAPLPTSTLFDVMWEDRTPFYANLVSSEQSDLANLPGATVYHLEITLDETMASIRGREELLYTNREDMPLGELYLRLYPNLVKGISRASDVLVNSQPVSTTLELENSALRIPLEPPLQPGSQVVVSLNFTVAVPTTAEGNYGAFAYQEAIAALAHFYPMVAVYDDEGWNIEVPPSAGDRIYAESSFYLVRVTAPANMVLVTSGIITDNQRNPAEQTVVAAAGPSRDFYIAASPRYVPVSKTVGETTIISYSPLEYQDRALLMLDYTAYAVDLYSALFGPYPFTELEIASTINEETGIEYPGVFVMSMVLYTPEQEYNVPDSYYLESTTVHETSHQWFYNVVGNDQLDEPWLDEALAQYVTYRYFVDRYGVEGAQEFYNTFDRRWGRGSAYADIPIGLPVRDYIGLEYSAIIYGRGPLFFMALEDLMGVETFTAFLRDYYQTYKWGVVTGNDFRTMAEAHCACDLTTLFATWVEPR